MHNALLKDQTYRKLKLVAANYETLIFEKIGELENVRGLQTRAHYRTVPTEGLTPLEKGFAWGGVDVNLWAVGSFTVPAQAAGRKLYAVSHANGREELFFVNGVPKGIFSRKNEAVSGEHAARLICENAVPGATYALALECLDAIRSSGEDRFDYNSRASVPAPGDDDRPGRVYEGVDVCVMNEDVKDFCFDMRELLQLVFDVPDKTYIRARARRTLDQVSRELILCPQHYEKEVWMASVRKCLTYTRPFFSRENNRILGRVGVVGHSHLDTAWLWEVKETIRKSARTFSNVLHLMEEYPDFVFMQSSPLHAKWLKDAYPTVFEDMKRRIAEGRYELNGGVFVECDCNITAGEMMIRQFLKGQQFTRENFGYLMDTFWLPDTFGYNGSIPQIMKGCGVKYFVTNKINCNEINPVEHETFLWRGIDGSEVLSHIPVSGGHVDVKEIFFTADGIRDKDATDKRLLAFGYGDGGGGPTYGMIEEARRGMGCEGMPQTSMTTVSAFLQELEREDRDHLHVYDDEIYFEFHRGTLTQNHNVKRKTRKADFAFRDMEYFNVLSAQPKNPEADRTLENLLLNQFHDILPGTCINPVYEVFNREMDDNLDFMRRETQRFAQTLGDGARADVTLYNTLSFDRRDVVSLDGARTFARYPSQTYTDICGREKTDVGGVAIPAFGAVVLTSGAPLAAARPFSYDEKTGTVETPFARVQFDADGYIASFIDKTSGRELRKPGGAPLNAFLIAEDCPEKWDNWNIDSDTFDRLRPVRGFAGRELISIGAVELRLRARYRILGETKLVQDMVFYADTPRVDFHTLVDWNAKHQLLKAGFALDLRAREARCEIQYGHVVRPTHQSTPYDMAKFEVCNHKWTDVSESRFGVALLNDCKYGVSFLDCNLALTLMRGGCSPDDTGDRGVHEMTYSLLPHASGFCAERVIRPAYELNAPAVATPGGTTHTASFLTIDAPNVICEAVKPAEADENAYVLRLYECEGTAANATVRLSRPAKRAYLTDMLENKLRELPLADNGFTVRFSAFQIATCLIET